MQKIISFLVVATIAIPFTFAASGDSTPALTPTPKVTTMNAPSETVAASGVTSQSTGVSLGESKSVSCSSNPAFGTNSCDQCFDGGSVTVGKKLTGLFDNWSNDTSSLMIAYKDEQKNPNMVSFGTTKWITTPVDETKMWKNSSDIIWSPTQSGSSKSQYILGTGQKVKFLEADIWAWYTLEKTDRKNGELVGMMRYPIVAHTVDAAGNESAAKTHYECVAYNLSAPAVTPATTTPAKPTPITPAITKTETGPTETIILILAAFFIAFGLMFSLRKRI